MNWKGTKEQTYVEPRAAGLKRRLLFALVLILVIGIIAGLSYVYANHPEKIQQLKGYGYLGVFLISIILNATVILPAGNILVIAALGATLPSATLVGVVGGVGAAIGEITAYMMGYSGQAIIQNKKRDIYNKLECWVKRKGPWAVFVLSAVPFAFDLAGIAAGALRMPFWKFLIACWLGRTALYIVTVWLGAPWWDALISLFNLQAC